MFILANAFSINMLSRDCTVHFEQVSEQRIKDILGSEKWLSSIGHPATATVLSQRLGVAIPCERSSIQFNPLLGLVVAQVTMPRLAEGQILSKEEMQQVPITFWEVFMDE